MQFFFERSLYFKENDINYKDQPRRDINMDACRPSYEVSVFNQAEMS